MITPFIIPPPHTHIEPWKVLGLGPRDRGWQRWNGCAFNGAWKTCLQMTYLTRCSLQLPNLLCTLPSSPWLPVNRNCCFKSNIVTISANPTRSWLVASFPKSGLHTIERHSSTGDQFQSRMDHRITRTRIIWFPSVPPGKWHGSTLN
jgi:hypothetical protein